MTRKSDDALAEETNGIAAVKSQRITLKERESSRKSILVCEAFVRLAQESIVINSRSSKWNLDKNGIAKVLS